MMKKALLPLIIVLLLLLSIGAFLFYDKTKHRALREQLNPNKVSLINNSNLSTKDFSIKWSCNGEELVIYKNEKYLNPKFKEYGHNHFKLYYMDSLCAHFGQRKHNNWHGHHYIFTIQKDKNISLTAEGPDAERIYRID